MNREYIDKTMKAIWDEFGQDRSKIEIPKDDDEKKSKKFLNLLNYTWAKAHEIYLYSKCFNTFFNTAIKIFS